MMEFKLQQNDWHYPCWLTQTQLELRKHLLEEVGELVSAAEAFKIFQDRRQKVDVLEEAADVALLAMMIADNVSAQRDRGGEV